MIFKAPQTISKQIFSLLSWGLHQVRQQLSPIIYKGSSASTHFHTFEQQRSPSQTWANKTYLLNKTQTSRLLQVSEFGSLNVQAHTCHNYSYTRHCLHSHWTPTRRSVQRCLAPAVFFFCPFPCPAELPGQKWAGPVWTTGLILQVGVGHFLFYLSSLFPSVCSLSTLFLGLHPAVCELQ